MSASHIKLRLKTAKPRIDRFKAKAKELGVDDSGKKMELAFKRIISKRNQRDN